MLFNVILEILVQEIKEGNKRHPDFGKAEGKSYIHRQCDCLRWKSNGIYKSRTPKTSKGILKVCRVQDQYAEINCISTY